MGKTKEEILKEIEDVKNGIRYYTEELEGHPNEEWIQVNYKLRLEKNQELLESLRKELEDCIKNTVEFRKFDLMEGGCFVDTYAKGNRKFQFMYNINDAELFIMYPDSYEDVIRDIYVNKCRRSDIDIEKEPFETWKLKERLIPKEFWKNRKDFVKFGISFGKNIVYVEGEKKHGKK